MDLEKMQKVNEILQLCFEINRFEQRQKKKQEINQLFLHGFQDIQPHLK